MPTHFVPRRLPALPAIVPVPSNAQLVLNYSPELPSVGHLPAAVCGGISQPYWVWLQEAPRRTEKPPNRNGSPVSGNSPTVLHHRIDRRLIHGESRYSVLGIALRQPPRHPSGLA